MTGALLAAWRTVVAIFRQGDTGKTFTITVPNTDAPRIVAAALPELFDGQTLAAGTNMMAADITSLRAAVADLRSACE